MIFFFLSPSDGRVTAVPLSAAVDGFKSHLVFKEIEKKLQEVFWDFFYVFMTGHVQNLEGMH